MLLMNKRKIVFEELKEGGLRVRLITGKSGRFVDFSKEEADELTMYLVRRNLNGHSNSADILTHWRN